VTSTSNQPTITEQKEFWNWHWQHWQDRKTVNEWKRLRHEKVLAFLASLSLHRPTILDVGCGPGFYTDTLRRFGEVTGLDLSEEAVAIARSRFPQIHFIAGNFYELALPNRFDVVISHEVIDHVEDQTMFVQRAAQVLQPGGHLILSCTNKFVMDRVGDSFPAQPPQHISRYMDRRTLKRLLQPHFKWIKSETIIPLGHFGILRAINSPKVNKVLGTVVTNRRLDRMKEIAGLGYQIIAVAKLK
jgi:2-polyprenyl-3-methyl-5-hydroxy-6-metoxy-1,4-benzoquinol methylase